MRQHLKASGSHETCIGENWTDLGSVEEVQNNVGTLLEYDADARRRVSLCGIAIADAAASDFDYRPRHA